MYYLYEIEFPNGMIYVGYSCDTERRFKEHKKHIVNKLLNEQIEEFGWDKAEFNTVDELPNEAEAKKAEKDAIKKYSKVGRSLNYRHNESCGYEDYSELDDIDRTTERLIVQINENLHQRFKEKVKSEGRSMKWYINRWVKEYTYDKKEVNNYEG